MQSPIYDFPENAVLNQFERERLPIIANNYAGNELFPIVEENAANILWEIRDNVEGMTFAVGAGEAFPNTDPTGVTRFYTPAGRFGEARTLDSEKIERGRNIGQFGQAIDVSAEMGVQQEEMAIREQVLIEYLRWQLLVSGSAQALKKDGTPITVATFPVQSYTPVNPGFNTTGSATPFFEFENLRQTYNGYGHDFGAKGKGFLNSRTLDSIVNNTNQSDLGSRRLNFGQTLNSVVDLNKIFLGQNLPTLIAYDETYLNSSGVPTRYIPDGYIVVVGWRPGMGCQLGNYLMTRNVNNPGGEPGLYVASGIHERAPRTPWTERGHNGGLRQTYRRQVVVMNAWA
jgi:hypothetical protein